MEICTSCTANIVNQLVCGAIREASYYVRFNKYVKGLEAQKEKLQSKIDSVLDRAKEDRKNTKTIVKSVDEWLSEADSLTAKVVELEEKAKHKRMKTSCLNYCPPNLIRRYSLGKKLEEMTKQIDEHTKIEFSEGFSRLASLVGINYYSSDGFLQFDSRKEAYGRLLEALKDDKTHMIGFMRNEAVTERSFQARLKGKSFGKDKKKHGGDKTEKGKTAMSSKEPRKRGKFPICKVCQRDNHLEKDCWYKGKGPIQCRFCKKMGHIERNCRMKQKLSNEQPQQQANFTDEQEEADDRAVAFRGMVSTRMEGRVDSVEAEMGAMKGTMGVMQKDTTELKECFLEIKESLGRMENGARKDREFQQSE
ncbi:putative disease resistance protein [Senna tora]|uniref:Putative disease resistance protein n=1 Tax=Senna tora TaxID=362788 RepID=A0A835C8F7_9FABA|nr:putative disease resistance protein [Senna tora]